MSSKSILLNPGGLLSEIDSALLADIAAIVAPDGVGEAGEVLAFTVPDDYITAPEFRIVSAANANAGQGVRFSVKYFLGPGLDPVDWLREGGATANYAAAMDAVEESASGVAADFSPGTFVVMFIGRDRSHADDTLPGSAAVVDVLFGYS